MKPDYVIYHGDCRTVLKELPAASVHCVVTSPPYWGLRKYEGVEPSVWNDYGPVPPQGHTHSFDKDGYCTGCLAWYGLLGLEPTIDMYIVHIVECFREVKRVLRDDGVLWLNISDKRNKASTEWLGMPHDVRKALQQDGWLYADEVVWHKPNPMPESSTKRTTRAHEYLFLLTKQPKYYYDAEAVAESSIHAGQTRVTTRKSFAGQAEGAGVRPSGNAILGSVVHIAKCRNKRSVWTIPTEGLSEAHFAAFPRKLVRPCILAGTSEKGCCPECGTPWKRIVKREHWSTRPARDNKQDETGMANRDPERHVTDVTTLGWRAGCDCTGKMKAKTLNTDGTPGEPVEVYASANCLTPLACTVLDPYVGSGQAGIVATQQGRKFIGIDASETYCEMARRRIVNPEPEPEIEDAEGQMTMFEETTECQEAS